VRRALFVILLLTIPARAQLVENVAARSDPTQTYTLFLPRTYDPSKTHPLLLVFDPRGRGTQAATIFQAGAEEYGWIVISSNQTRSDGSTEPNDRAVRALLEETSRYAVDEKRIYATGFSGTAILAWGVGIVTKRLAGVIAVGGRYVESVPPSRFNFAHYGFAGHRDFNNREMRLVEERLDGEGRIPHRFQPFDGDHRWIPPELAREAIGWMEVLAGNARIRNAVFNEDVSAADALQGLDALRRYRAILRTYDSSTRNERERETLERIRARVVALENDSAVQRSLAEEKKWDEFEADYGEAVFARIPALFASLRAQETPPNAADVARAFRVPDLRRRAARGGAEGMAAGRLLEAVYGQTSFYLLRPLFASGQYALAAAVLGVAVDLHPERPDAWYNLGAAQARAGNRRQALAALQRSIDAGFRDAKGLASDDDYASLRRDRRFQELLALASRSQ
jgi:tetratricopeptide (TPR) repeat protein